MNKKLKELIILADVLDQKGFHKLAESVDSITKYAAEFEDEKTNPGKVSVKLDGQEPVLKELIPEGDMKDEADAHAVVRKLAMFLSKHSWPHQWGDDVKKELRWLLGKVLELT